MQSTNRGVVLLEVLVALMILSAAGLGMVALLHAGLAEEHRSRERERVLAAEERLLAAVSLLKGEELNRRLGHHPFGAFVVEVQRPEQTLYRIAVAEGRTPEVEDLVTVVYRPARASAP